MVLTVIRGTAPDPVPLVRCHLRPVASRDPGITLGSRSALVAAEFDRRVTHVVAIGVRAADLLA
jgi:hypothetical protein